MSIKDQIRTKPRLWASAGLVTVGLASGAVLGTTLSAQAASSTSSTSAPASSSSSSSSGQSTPANQPPAMGSMPAHGSAAHESAETPVTGDNATKAQAAAVKSVGSGTAGAVTTDFTKNGYEVTVTKADGSTVEVHLDSSFNVLQGGPGHMGGPGGPDGAAPPSGTGTAPPSSGTAA